MSQCTWCCSVSRPAFPPGVWWPCSWRGRSCLPPAPRSCPPGPRTSGGRPGSALPGPENSWSPRPSPRCRRPACSGSSGTPAREGSVRQSDSACVSSCFLTRGTVTTVWLWNLLTLNVCFSLKGKLICHSLAYNVFHPREKTESTQKNWHFRNQYKILQWCENENCWLGNNKIWFESLTHRHVSVFLIHKQNPRLLVIEANTNFFFNVLMFWEKSFLSFDQLSSCFTTLNIKIRQRLTSLTSVHFICTLMTDRYFLTIIVLQFDMFWGKERWTEDRLSHSVAANH